MSTSLAQANLLELNDQKKAADAGRRRNLGAVTALRFFACLLVLVCHSTEVFGIHIKLNGADLGYWQGLTCFFVISGFVMVYVHPSIPDAQSEMRYMAARFARIWPTHFCSFLAFVAVFPACVKNHSAWLYAIFNLTMTHSWTLWRPIWGSFNTPSWSLSVEIFFYLCFPFLLRSLKTTWQWKLLATLVLALVQVALCTWDVYPNFVSFGTAAPALINVNPLSRLFEFTTGMVIGLHFSNSKFLANMGVRKATILEVLACLGVIGCVVMPAWWQPNSQMLYLEPFRCWVQYCGIAPAYGFLIFMMARSQGLISRLLENKSLVFLGELSFSMYLFHYPILLFFIGHCPSLMNCGNLWAIEIVWLLTVLVVATTSFKLMETPARKFLIAFLTSPRFLRKSS